MVQFNPSDRDRLSSVVAVSEIRFDRMVRMVRNDRLGLWA